MKRYLRRLFYLLMVILLSNLFWLQSSSALAADRLVGIYSARVMSQSLPWMARDAGLFRKYDLDFQLVFVASSAFVTAAMLGGDAEISLLGGVGIVRAFVQGVTDLAFLAGVKNVMTQSIVAQPEIKRVEDLKGKKIAVSRVGGNTHYFSVQVLRRYGMDASKDVTFIQTGGEPEALAAMISGAVHAATMTPPADFQAVSHGAHRLVYGPDLRIPYAATIFAARRSLIAKKPQVIGRFLKAIGEASKILHTDKEFAYKVLAKELRVNDRKVLDAAYNAEITALERRLDIKAESLQAILDEVSQVDPRAKKVKPQDLVERRYLDEMEQSGFFNKLWAEKR